MRLVSYRSEAGPGWGVLVDGGVADSRQIGEGLPNTLLGFIERCAEVPELRDTVARRAAAATPTPLAAVQLLPCVPAPGKIVCLGVNYHDHAKEGGNKIVDYPALFLRCASSLLAHGAPLRVPRI